MSMRDVSLASLQLPEGGAYQHRAQLLKLLREYFLLVPMPDGLATASVADPEFLACWALQALQAGQWRSANTPPEPSPQGTHFPITVLAVIDDPRMRINGDEPFVDTASWWPAARKWTVTHQVRSDADAVDYQTRVVAWQPMRELPPPWSELWA